MHVRACSRLPSSDCDYIDADGKCHKGKPPVGDTDIVPADSQLSPVEPLAIPKQDVRGVAGL